MLGTLVHGSYCDSMYENQENDKICCFICIGTFAEGIFDRLHFTYILKLVIKNKLLIITVAKSNGYSRIRHSL